MFVTGAVSGGQDGAAQGAQVGRCSRSALRISWQDSGSFSSPRPGRSADSEEFKLALMIADIHQEVHGLVKSCDSHKMLSKLAIQIKPTKGIIAKAAFPKGKLVLVPYSMKVITRKIKAEPLPNAVRVVCPAWKEREFWLANPNQWPKESSEDSGFISPVFCMQNTDEEDLATWRFSSQATRLPRCAKVRIPLYRNTKKIAIDDHLQISKVKNVASQIAAEEPPAKRPKK